MHRIRNGLIGALGFAVVVLPTAASAEVKYTSAQGSACIGDAIRLCSSVLSSKDRIYSCLLSKKYELSPRCRAVAVSLGVRF
jgi:hypothetical protein